MLVRITHFKGNKNVTNCCVPAHSKSPTPK